MSRLCLILLVALIAPNGAAAPPTGQSRDRTPPAPRNLVEVISLLQAEARAAWESGELPRDHPDIAYEHEIEFDQEELHRLIGKRLAGDGFVDAYVRWQLLSYELSFIALDENAFRRLLQTAPAMVPNPKADALIVQQFEQLDKAGPRGSRELERVHEVEAELDDGAARAARLNQPASEFYDAVAGQLEDSGIRPRQWLIARCAATIEAGWTTRTIKGDMTRSFTMLGAELDVPADLRGQLAFQVRKLGGMERRIVDQITYLADGSVSVKFSRAFVDRDDVERWIERMTPKDDGGGP